MTVGEPFGPGPETSGARDRRDERDAAEVDALRTGELVIIGRIPSASNATLVCDAVLGDTEVRCVYKPVRGEVPLWDFPDGTLAGREVSSYLVSEALGWSVIPTTIHRDGPLGPGMVQRWVVTAENDEPPSRVGTATDLPTPRVDLVDLCPADTVPTGYRAILRALDGLGEPVVLVHADDPRLQRMAVLDIVLNNADRKGGHVLEGLDGGVYGVDHGICLHTDDKLRTVLWGWAGEPIPAHLLADLAGLVDHLTSADHPLTTELAGHITDDEILAMAVRAGELVEHETMPLPPGHRPIPWPPF
ncbi:SCO1664 family protein [Gordonia sp. SL306]|uniref:SCO1664 family protein n=1 Tax=Gordonia sp. SL306 TaxID=2995145 RepID=UPI0022711758|nr:SCO1664 family protein [Gordonia sp. SL306]WAC55403.1 SCO1664 family protein [Gordonia sp. SL306]